MSVDNIVSLLAGGRSNTLDIVNILRILGSLIRYYQDIIELHTGDILTAAHFILQVYDDHNYYIHDIDIFQVKNYHSVPTYQ